MEYDFYSRFFRTPSRNRFISPLSFLSMIFDRRVSVATMLSICAGVLGLKRISVSR